MRSSLSRVVLSLGLLLATLALFPEISAREGAVAADEGTNSLTHLLRYADISKDKVVFVYAGNLWVASRQGGNAHRLTANVGGDQFPKFSPDGKWIAFTAPYDGNPDV